MKKVMLSLVAILSAISLVGCEAYDNSVKEQKAKEETFNSYFDFVMVAERTNYTGKFEYVYVDRNTKVLYYVAESSRSYGITPILNADGTLKLYEGDLTK